MSSLAAPSRPSKAPEGLFGTVTSIGLALLIALVLKSLIFQPFTIPSSSMEPTLRTGDYLIVSKFAYGWSRFSFPFNPPVFKGRILGAAPKRGDVIVFKLPRDHGKTDYVKRLIGLPGDRVQVLRGQVFIDGAPLPRAAGAVVDDPEMAFRRVTEVAETNPEGRRYVTYSESPDHEGETTGVYVVPKGQYFFMGDNRDNSLDSRWPGDVGVGFVPAEDLEGRVEMVLASWHGASIFKPWTWVTRLDWGRLLHRVS